MITFIAATAPTSSLVVGTAASGPAPRCRPGRSVADLRTVHVQAMLTAIARQRAAQGQPVTTAMLARIEATLRAALNAAIRAGYLANNPASRAEIPVARRPRPIVWTAARVRDWEQTRIRPPVAVWTPAQTATSSARSGATGATRSIT